MKVLETEGWDGLVGVITKELTATSRCIPHSGAYARGGTRGNVVTSAGKRKRGARFCGRPARQSDVCSEEVFLA